MSINELLVYELITPLSFDPEEAYVLYELKAHFESSKNLLHKIITFFITFPVFSKHLARHSWWKKLVSWICFFIELRQTSYGWRTSGDTEILGNFRKPFLKSAAVFFKFSSIL